MSEIQSSQEPLRRLIEAWRTDPNATYRNWFLWEDRLKNFYKGSSLETAVKCVAEQRQIFKGADHAFLWKPKLRIPDIYEAVENQRAFGRFLDTCACCSAEGQVLEAIAVLDRCRIKGLGPAAANLLYFLHPTIATPFNTAIVRGYNAVTGAKVKLGSWPDYLAMRSGALRLNAQYRDILSNDLGAVAGFLFDVGSGRYSAPPSDGEGTAAWERDLAAVREKASESTPNTETDQTHTEIQGWLRDVGLGLGYGVWIASNDRGRAYNGGRLSDGCVADLRPFEGYAGIDAVRLIDVLWLGKQDGAIHAAFEVEHTTSIYSGIVRMLDLALGPCGNIVRGIFLVAPDIREAEVRAQMARPAFAAVADLDVRYLAYGELERHRDSIIRFGEGLKAIRSISKALP
jgi:type II restriction enzyme